MKIEKKSMETNQGFMLTIHICVMNISVTFCCSEHVDVSVTFSSQSYYRSNSLSDHRTLY